MKTSIYAIGDIHGQLDLLLALYERIAAHAAANTAERRVLVHLGDYVDRGPDSKGVIERVMRGLDGFENVALKGNHEALLLDFLNGDESVADFWLGESMGGSQALRSFGIDPQRAHRDHRMARTAVGERILEWLHELKISYQEGGFYFAHAGVLPGVPLAEQVEEHLIWIRDRFTNSQEDFGLRVVHGHTPAAQPAIKRNRIGLDTGACWTGRLTAAVLDPEHPQDDPLILTANGEPSRDAKRLLR